MRGEQPERQGGRWLHTAWAGRLIGTLLALTVVVTVLVIARWDGVRVPGSAIGTWTIGVPAAGDCVAAFTGPTPSMPPLIFGTGAAVVGDRSVLFSGCSAAHIGEVVAFRRVASGIGDAAGSDALWCTRIAIGYDTPLPQSGEVAVDGWRPAVAERFVAIVSGPDADANGRRWAACAVMAPALESYQGSFVWSMAHTPAPPPFGICRTGELPGRRVSCAAPHGEQVFGTAVTTAEPGQGSCRALVRRATAMDDASGGGRLEVRISGTGSVLSCAIRAVGHERLTGTLLGIGDGPLPLGG